MLHTTSNKNDFRLEGDVVYEGFFTTADRDYILDRLFLMKAGFTVDTLPYRMLNESQPAGPVQGCVVEFDIILTDFYIERDWDENVKAVKEILEKLGLEQGSLDNSISVMIGLGESPGLFYFYLMVVMIKLHEFNSFGYG